MRKPSSAVRNLSTVRKESIASFASGGLTVTSQLKANNFIEYINDHETTSYIVLLIDRYEYKLLHSRYSNLSLLLLLLRNTLSLSLRGLRTPAYLSRLSYPSSYTKEYKHGHCHFTGYDNWFVYKCIQKV
ncbi:unnamed protein product [Trichobilharzia regenti]|nr:unnamed protein product [Trichobilharzia regenti]